MKNQWEAFGITITIEATKLSPTRITIFREMTRAIKKNFAPLIDNSWDELSREEPIKKKSKLQVFFKKIIRH